MSNTDFYPIIKYPFGVEKFAKEQKIDLWKNKHTKKYQVIDKYLLITNENIGKLSKMITLFVAVILIVIFKLSSVYLLVYLVISVVINYWVHEQIKGSNNNLNLIAKKHLESLDKSQKNNPLLSLASYFQSNPPLKGIGLSASQRGVSEAFFLNYLERFLPAADISWKMKFAIPRKISCSSVDFVLVEPQTGLSLIIEIDEPYVSKNKFKSYHCLNNSDEYQRDIFLLTQNLIVLRFAEEQIVRYPRSCCLTVANILWQLTGNLEYLYTTNQIKPLPSIKRWTSIQARKMWKRNYRQKYLAATGVAYFSPSEYKFARRYQKLAMEKIPKW